MILHRHRRVSFYALVIATFVMGCCGPVNAQQKAALSVGSDAIGGRVTGPNGPEAGVWVIAETTDLPTKFAKMVVTNDQGQFLIPQLPSAKYKIWARGYGLVDSDKQDVVPGKDHRSDRKAGAERGRRRGILSRHVLVLDAQDPRRQRVSRLGQEPEPHPGRHGFTGHLDR